jgi:hypothetical protein
MSLAGAASAEYYFTSRILLGREYRRGRSVCL